MTWALIASAAVHLLLLALLMRWTLLRNRDDVRENTVAELISVRDDFADAEELEPDVPGADVMLEPNYLPEVLTATETDLPKIDVPVPGMQVTPRPSEAKQDDPDAKAEKLAALLQVKPAGFMTEEMQRGSSSGMEQGWAAFFGTIAGGQRFVYVLDVSASMASGERLTRASAEIMRSIDQLDQKQQFYVILFADRTWQMLGQRASESKMLDATEANKQRLAEWLASPPTGKFTDPRKAMKLALSLNPSAVFLLSDGDFVGDDRRSIAENTEYRIQYWNQAGVPIHTIAFEDPRGSETLEQIASDSDGTFRFISAHPPRSHGPRRPMRPITSPTATRPFVLSRQGPAVFGVPGPIGSAGGDGVRCLP